MGVLPLSAFAAEGLSSAPSSITQRSSDYMKIGGRSVRYKAASSVINNVGLPYVFDEQVDVPGFGATRALCVYQKGTLGPAANGQKWNYKEEVTHPSLVLLLSYIYSHTYGNFTDEGNAVVAEHWNQYWSDIWFMVAQAMMRYDITVANTSNVPLSEFYWHDRIPTDATRATVLTTGTYSARLNYRVLYKTNYRSGYQVLASNLLTSSNYSFSLNAIPTQAGEYVTDVYFDFGKVPVGFQSTINPTLTVQVLGTVANNYQIINRADVGGKYQGTWQTGQATWLTIVRRLGPVPTLPKTGY